MTGNISWATRVYFFLNSTSGVPDFPGFATPNSGLHYFYPFFSSLTHQLWSHNKNGNFPFFTQPGVLPLSIMPYIAPNHSAWGFWLFWGHERTVEGLSSLHLILTLQCGVKYPCHFFGKNPDDPGYIMDYFLTTWTTTLEWYLCSLVLPRGGKKPYKAIFCLFHRPENPLAGFSTLPSLCCFFQSFTKNNDSHKNSSHVLTCYVPGPVLDDRSMLSHVTCSINIGGTYQCPLSVDEETEVWRSQESFVWEPCLAAPESHEAGPVAELVHSAQSPLSFPITRDKGISAAFLAFFFPDSFESPEVYGTWVILLGRISQTLCWTNDFLAL